MKRSYRQVMERPGMSRFGLVRAKRTSLLVIIFVLFVALLASCSGGTDQGNKGSDKEDNQGSDNSDKEDNKGSNKEEETTSASRDRTEGEGSEGSSEDASKELAMAPGSEDQNESGDIGSNGIGSSPNYPDPPPRAPGYLPALGSPAGQGLYHPDVDSDGVGSGDEVMYLLDTQPPGWVDYNGIHWDNCPETFNPDQEDTDVDGWGDLCDPEPLIPYDPNQAR